MMNYYFKKYLLSVLILIGSLSTLMAQTIEVKGRVVDNQSVPMFGVSVVEKGTTNGAVTNLDGYYQLTVQQGATLVFSFIGFNSQEHVVNSETLNVTLEEEIVSLEELIVVGYGVQRKSSLTGAVSSVKSEDIEARTITRPEQALQGKLPVYRY